MTVAQREYWDNELRVSNSVEGAVDRATALLDLTQALGRGYSAILSRKAVAKRAFDLAFSSEATVATIFFLDSSNEYIPIIHNMIVEGIDVAFEAATSKTLTSSFPLSDAMTLANKMGALYNAQDILAGRDSVVVMQDYMQQYYAYGGSDATLARALSLPATSTTSVILNAIARKYGYGTLEFKGRATTKLVASLKRTVDEVASACMRGDCGASSASSEPSTPPSAPMPSVPPAAPVTPPPPGVPQPTAPASPVSSATASSVTEAGRAVVALLGDSTGATRNRILGSLLAANRVASGLTVADVNAIIAGMENQRRRTINQLARRIVPNLSAADVVSLSGQTKSAERNAILASLLAADRVAEGLSVDDVNLIIVGMEDQRARTINQLSQYVAH